MNFIIFFYLNIDLNYNLHVVELNVYILKIKIIIFGDDNTKNYALNAVRNGYYN